MQIEGGRVPFALKKWWIDQPIIIEGMVNGGNDSTMERLPGQQGCQADLLVDSQHRYDVKE